MTVYYKSEVFPKITVITASYNLIEAGREQCFKECLESVRNQSYPNIEHIIIDGASTDGTLTLLEEYRKKGYIEYYTEPDNGLYDAMNKGIKRSTGKYVAFLNSDDFYHNPDAVAESVHKLEQEDADFSCATTLFVRDEEIVASIFPMVGTFMIRMPFCHQSMFTKRDVLINEGGFDSKNYKSAADYDLIMRLLLRGYKPCVIEEDIVSFRDGGFSTCGRRLSDEECEQIWKKYLPAMEYLFVLTDKGVRIQCSIQMKELTGIKIAVHETVWDAVLKVKQFVKDGKVVFKPRSYHVAHEKTYRIIGIPLFSYGFKNVPNWVYRRIWRVFSLKFFEIKKTKSDVTYKLLNISFLRIKF